MLFCARSYFILAAGLLSLISLAACTSAGSNLLTSSALSGGSGGDPKGAKKVYTAEDFAPDVYCPPVVVRNGTESLDVFERGHEGEQDFVRFQASISKTARECHMNGDTLSIKLGINGRVVAGPKGGAASLSLPLRVAIVKQMGGKGPLYSQLFKIPVSVSAPDFGSDFSQVYDQIALKIAPDDRNLIVYVGFDEGKKPPPPSG